MNDDGRLTPDDDAQEIAGAVPVRGHCAGCGIEMEQWAFAGFRMPTHCEKCLPQASKVAEESQERDRRAYVARLFPPLYAEIAKAYKKDFPPVAWAEITRWNPEGLSGLFRGHGLMIAGPSGKFKSTMAICHAGNLHLRTGVSLGYLSVPEFETVQRLAMFGTEDEKMASRLALKAARACRVLVLDDLGKESATEQIERELFSLLNYRIERLRPSIITLNTSREDYRARLSPDRAEPMLRRLSQYHRLVLVE